MIRLLVTTTPEDAAAMAVLMEGMNAHAEADAFPIWMDDAEPIPEAVYKLLPYLRTLHDTWLISVEAEHLEVMVKLMESVEWKYPTRVHIADETASKKWHIAAFHKAVMVDKIFI